MSIVTFDKQNVKQSFSRAVDTYEQAAVVQKEVSKRMMERLKLVKLKPKRILDMGAGTGIDTEQLLSCYPKARVVSMDFALPMLQRARRRGNWRRRPRVVCADMERLPFADNSIDLLYSNFALQWVNSLDTTFKDCLRVVRPGGLLMFSTLGPDTLKELRAAWGAVDDCSHVSPFMDMHDVGDILVNSGYADPVMDVEHITLTYSDVNALMRDLKAVGAHNASHDRKRGLTGPRRLQAMRDAYEQFRREDRLPASYEVVYGHAWVPEQKRQAGEAQIPIDMINRQR